MKKRLRKTGEIVDVVSFNNFYQSERDDSDQVSYIDSKGVEHHHVRGLNLWWDFEDVGKEPTKEIDWEQVRIDASIAAMAALANACNDMEERACKGLVYNVANDAVRYADALIAELKKGGEK